MEVRNERVLQFIEQRHYLSLARKHDEHELAKKITEANHLHVRLTNMVNLSLYQGLVRAAT